MTDTKQRLTVEQLEVLRRRLEQECSRIVTVLRAPTITAAADAEQGEFEEAAQRATEQDDQLEIGERGRALLAEVERALEKHRTDTYGLEEETGDPIPYERLAAIPWARGLAN
jgi:DnaK suppressor protein